MENAKKSNNSKKKCIILKTIHFPFFILLILIQIKQIFLGYFDSLTTEMLNEDASLIDISDYHNLFIIMTTDKKIYTGIPPIFKIETSSKINSFSAAATYNNEYILMACTEDYLLSKINIETGEETPLINYEKFNSPNCTCSISLKNNFVYIGISHIIIPKYRINQWQDNNGNDNNISDSNSEMAGENNISTGINENICSDINCNDEDDDFFYFYDYDNKYLQNTVLKIKLINDNDNINNPLIDEAFNILNYTFEFQHKFLDHIPFPRPFSCEIIDIENASSEHPRLVCGNIIVNETSQNNFLYLINVSSINSSFDGIEDVKTLYSQNIMPYIRLQRVDSNTIKFLFSKNTYKITIKLEESKYKIQSSSSPSSLYHISSGDLFFYNNYYLFVSSFSDIIIKKSSTDNYIRIQDNNKDIKKIMGYYESEGDKILFIYEYDSKKIKYFTIEGMNYLFNIETKIKKIDVISNTITDYNVGGLITNPTNHNLILSFYSLVYFKSTKQSVYEYDKYTFNKDSQNLNVQGSLNDWIYFTFYYKETTTTGLSTEFFFDNSKVMVRTCLFKCGQCLDLSSCEYGTCKSNFSLLRDSEDHECYPIDQNFPYYIHNKTSNYFEKCYETCIFCSMENSNSTKEIQNCIVCKEGYLRSYSIMGNCYPIEYPQNNSEVSKVLKDENGEKSFEIITSSCLDINKLKINDTGECVDSCPLNTVYYTYYKNTSFNFSKQEETSMGLLYPLTKEKTPKYLFNKVCYSTCPSLTYGYSKNNENVCKCSYGWHKDEATGDIICYDNMNYCSSKEYYYHTDDKECVLNGCKDNYYQINFECYKDECPENTRQISSDIKQCESKLKYCYIDEHFQTKCSNTPKEGYNLKYDKTNTYFQSCDDYIYYFNEKTYLYMNTCYKDCPEETTRNDTNDRCSCNYYIYYVNEERTDYECLKETEKCWDKKRYNITDRKECVDTIDECTGNNYKVFSDECLPTCPENSEIKETEGICLCKFNYYNDSNILTCLENGKSCEEGGFPIKMNTTNECFKNKFECIKRGFKFYDNICYEEQCPDNTIEKNNDGICSCLYYYFNNSDILTCFNDGETCQTKGYPITNIDSKECFTSLDICRNRELKIFNNNCYNICPENTIPKNGDTSCICSEYFYTDENNLLNCFTPGITCETESSNYPYANYETKECFRTKEKCLNRGLKVFNFECLLSSCPPNTIDKNHNNICLCSIYSLIDEENLLKCFSSEIECASQGYYFNKETKECFLSNNECLRNNKKLYGKECVNSCPSNSEIKQNSNICECSNYFYNNNGILNCFSSDKTCETEGYPVESDTKECFTSIYDCFSKNYLYYLDNKCYKNSCPNGKMPLNSITNMEKRTALITALNLDNLLASKICICDTTSTYYGWINKDNSNPSIQKCLYKCPLEYDLDDLTKKCYYLCDKFINYVFNDVCYKTQCPEGTQLNPSNPNSRICVCEDKTKVDKNSGLITCEDIYPELYYEDPQNCPFFYKQKCVLKCPENTCLTTKNQDLAKCIDIRPNIKVYNEICIEGINELIQNLEEDEVVPIMTSSGIAISAFSADASMEELIQKYPSLSFVDLGECKDKLKEAYKLPPDTKLFILGVDTPPLYGNSSINVFNYEIYLQNGTQLKDFSACDGVKITISSNINNLDLVNFYKAMEFYNEGYDIYNRSNIFYVDPCAPAQDDGNDITLEDRAKYYFPNVSICNEGCIYKVVNFSTQRFLCDCNANLSEKEFKQDDYNTPEEEIDDSSYLDYFLSLINYKIFLCINLFFEFESFYYNAGFYISFCTMLICIILLILFWIKGIKFIKVIIYKNIPTKEKLKELLRRKKRYTTNRSKKMNKSKNKQKSKNKNNDKNKNNNENNNMSNNCLKISPRKEIKFPTIAGTRVLKNNNPPPRYSNILKLDGYIKYKKGQNKQEKENNDKKFDNISNNNNIEICNNSNNNNKNTEKEENIEIELKKEKIKIYKKNKRNQDKYNSTNSTLHLNNENSSKDNLKCFNNKIIKEKSEEDNREELITQKGEENIDKKEKVKKEKKDKKNKKNKKESKKKTKKINSNKINNNNIFEYINRVDKKYNSDIIKNKKNIKFEKKNGFQNETEKNSNIFIDNKEEMIEDLELKIDFNYDHLIDRSDDHIEKRELNNIPYRQALRIDKRSFFQILLSVLTNQVEFLSLFLYRHPYSHFTLTVSVYLFELLLDLTMNCFLYTDDVVSEKYHNDGNLSMFTTLSLSFISNIISSIAVFIIAKLTNYPEIIEAIIFNIKDKRKYIENIVRLFKYIKLRLGFFYFLQITFIVIMTYYLFIFCTVYHKSQASIMVNYIVGACTSLAISVGLTLIISILRTISIKYHHYQLFNVSKYLYEHF